eukprot:CAMPEP_0176379758 /NCGR_PEP_ID=MMETSP0126-20121128/30592_1 /TAXON_ID=141414 ORGANISM="Strombidinopsis acuminatum, Strain SPMC142" /NCGR_SAMPLE_ID=MMETSP0126 /ASSEMBLY_ACC=CAM_ASM_000229 /LENGTH=116 /DNA_ID=CAMNT_0017742683 /DNA_START=924 /DNA_END=1274 /DNA_ORIENTATION=+
MKICEDQILTYMDSKAACEILTNPSMLLPLKCDSSVRDIAKTVFLEEYERLEELYPDLEQMITQTKGLMSELFTHKKKKVRPIRKRKSFIGAEDSHKKKVRFNISSTVYEDAASNI